MQNDNFMSLRDELKLVIAYLELEQARFEDKLAVNIDIAAEAKETLLPQFILEPLVENAVKYGILPKGKRGVIAITARK